MEYQKIFDEYLHYLAILTCNLHLWSDLPVLIGGYAASFLAPYIDRLKAEIAELSIFTDKEEFLYLSQFQFNASSIGCAQYFTERFLNTL